MHQIIPSDAAIGKKRKGWEKLGAFPNKVENIQVDLSTFLSSVLLAKNYVIFSITRLDTV